MLIWFATDWFRVKHKKQKSVGKGDRLSPLCGCICYDLKYVETGYTIPCHLSTLVFVT